MCVLDMYVFETDFERHLNLGITCDHVMVLYEQILTDFLDTFLSHETIGVTHYYSIYSMQGIFSGVDVINLHGSVMKVDFSTTCPEFMDIISMYERKYDEFGESFNQGRKM